jgi:hypothetical protein
MGYKDLEVDEAVYNLRECLTKEVAAGASQADALAACHFWDYQPSGTRIPDTSWIEGYVQVAGEQWVDEGYGEEAVVAAERLKECLTKAVKAGASRDEAIAKCPAETFKPKVTPEPTETPTPEPTETPTPQETEG